MATCRRCFHTNVKIPASPRPNKELVNNKENNLALSNTLKRRSESGAVEPKRPPPGPLAGAGSVEPQRPEPLAGAGAVESKRPGLLAGAGAMEPKRPGAGWEMTLMTLLLPTPEREGEPSSKKLYVYIHKSARDHCASRGSFSNFFPSPRGCASEIAQGSIFLPKWVPKPVQNRFRTPLGSHCK